MTSQSISDIKSIKTLFDRCHINGCVPEAPDRLPSDSTVAVWAWQNFWRVKYQGSRIGWLINAACNFVLEKQQNPSKKVPDRRKRSGRVGILATLAAFEVFHAKTN
ncbi:hypothetical protein [Pseudomonas pergaminensis]